MTVNHNSVNSDNRTYRVDWQTVRRDWPGLLLVAAAWVISLWALPRLPDRVPIHWNAAGEVDGWGSPLFAALMVPALATGMYLLLLFLPLIDPRRRNYAYFGDFYRLMRQAVPGYLALIQAVVLGYALGYPVDPSLFIRLAIPVLFLFMGNYMGRVRHNYFVGIRTPWTLASEEVWVRTHRAAARLWVAGSLVMLAAAFLPGTWGFWVFMAVTAVMVIIPVIHSYLLWRRLENN
ncbi:MAG: SdpI family protein [Bacillota bacterium]|nr:MAG: hypothetical protein DIU70_05665 [Bacillota bacterium]